MARWDLKIFQTRNLLEFSWLEIWLVALVVLTGEKYVEIVFCKSKTLSHSTISICTLIELMTHPISDKVREIQCDNIKGIYLEDV